MRPSIYFNLFGLQLIPITTLQLNSTLSLLMTIGIKSHLFITEHSEVNSFQNWVGAQYVPVKWIKCVLWVDIYEILGTFKKTTLWPTFPFHALEKEMATHSSVLAWRIPGTGEPGGPPSMGSHRVGHNWSDLAAPAAKRHLRGITLPLEDKIQELHSEANHSPKSVFGKVLKP